MEKRKAYTWGVWGLGIIVFIRLLLLLILFNSVNKISSYHAKIPAINIFSLLEIVLLIVVVIEAMVYFVFRYRIQTGPLVLLHVWSLFFAMFLMPAISLLLVMILPIYFNRSEFTYALINLNKIRFYLGWPLILAAHIAFAIALVKSFKSKQAAGNTEEPGGILEEFTTD